MITAVTNEDGEIGPFFIPKNSNQHFIFLLVFSFPFIYSIITVKLPGGGLDVNPESQKQYSISNYVSHMPLSDLPELVFPPCDM